jgi:hypothetical protein
MKTADTRNVRLTFSILDLTKQSRFPRSRIGRFVLSFLSLVVLQQTDTLTSR